MLTLRVATPATGLIDTVGVPRHAVGPELTQVFVGSEGTLGVITRATLQLVPLPQERRFATVSFPTVGAGIHAIRRALQAGHRPSVVRMYDEEATRLTFAPVVGEDLSGVYTVLAFEGDSDAVDVEERRTLELAREAGGELLDPALGAALVGPPLRLLPPAAPAGAARDLGNARRGGDLLAHRGRLRRAAPVGARALRRRRPPAAHAPLPLVRVGDDDLRPLRRPRRRSRRARRCTTASGRTG